MAPSSLFTAATTLASPPAAAPVGIGACTPSCAFWYSAKPGGSATVAGPASVGFFPDAHAEICRNGLAQLSGAKLAQTKSAASRAHDSAARTTSSQPSGAGSYFEQLMRQVSNELFGHLAFTLSHISKHTS